MKRALIVSLISVVVALLTAGCRTPNKAYRGGNASVMPVTKAAPTLQSAQHPGACELNRQPCIAFLEFDDMGEMYDSDQLKRAEKLIGDSITEDPHTVVVMFIHGWKHNAKFDDENVRGFGSVLDFLQKKYGQRHIIGVYVGWRGELESKYWPVRRAFSYFNRESAAKRIPGPAESSAIYKIVAAAHGTPPPTAADPNPKPLGMVFLIGHSFGGLMLERAISQETATLLEEIGDDSGARRKKLADLVVFVNSAAAATEAKEMLDLLKKSEARYGQTQPVAGCEQTEQPVFVSISSTGDMATSFAMPVGHGPSFLYHKMKGSFRDKDPLECGKMDPEVAKNTPGCPGRSDTPSQGAFYMSTAAHMQILQSHVVEKVDNTKPQMPGTIRFPLLHSGTNGKPDDLYEIHGREDRWNDTPYWLMEVPPEVIPDHGTIFTERFIQMLTAFLPTQQQIVNPECRPRLTAPILTTK